MLEQVKTILIANYNKKIEEFEVIKNELVEVEKIIMEDNSEDQYKENLKQLKYKKLKKKSPEYIEELDKINSLYNQSLLDFKRTYEKYSELRKQAAKIDIYGYTRKITRVENATELKDLKIDEEKASKIISGELDDF